jgi:hypothetical protein
VLYLYDPNVVIEAASIFSGGVTGDGAVCDGRLLGGGVESL